MSDGDSQRLGAIAAIATVVAAIIAILTYFSIFPNTISGQPNVAGPGPTSVGPNPGPGDSGIPAPPSAVGSTQAPHLQKPWVGIVRLTPSGIDFTGDTPAGANLGFGPGIVKFHVNGSDKFLEFFETGAALWTAASDPSYDDCVGLLNTQSLSSGEALHVTYHPNEGVCASWANGVVFLRGDGVPSGEAVQMKAIRWLTS